MAVCRICSGRAGAARARQRCRADGCRFSPSAHVVGQHGDLLRCLECATVQQPILPRGDTLHDLYREMRDDDYLAEEEGRRATANRLLDLIGAHRPHGRLLDVGCGHGLLLDEARKRGYETVGLELCREAAAHARETLGLDVREVPLEAFGRARTATRRALRRGRARRRDRAPRRSGRRDRPVRGAAAAAAACSASSRPTRPRRPRSSRAARWWGYLPAHTVLLPRRTLRELISGARARDLRRRAVRAHVRRQALGRRAGGAARAGGSGRSTPLADRMPAVQALAVARRRARDPRPPHARSRNAEHPLLQHTERARADPRRAARLPGHAHDPGRGRRDAGAARPTARC